MTVTVNNNSNTFSHRRHHLVSFESESLQSSFLVLCHTLRDCFRVSFLCAVVCVAFVGPYSQLYDGWTKWMHNTVHESNANNKEEGEVYWSDRLFFMGITLIVHEGLYYFLNGMFMAFTYFGFFQQYRIERLASQTPSAKLIKKTLFESAIGHWVVQPLSLYLLFPLYVKRGMSVATYLPPFWLSVFQLAASILINDCLFYWGHRLLHHPRFYKRFHKQHHEYTGPIGFSAEYATPLEQFLSNQLPVVVGPILFGMSTLQWSVYLFWRLWRTYEVHSGYDFSGTYLGRIGLLHGHGARYHDYHHTHNVGTFGGPANAFWDYFFGTQNQFAKHEDKIGSPSYHTPYLF
eukprot:m.16758 g.16758  ORF g.16758 m.16758 type:complete len:347 (-) comp8042_c0_seq1:192-1232(-)